MGAFASVTDRIRAQEPVFEIAQFILLSGTKRSLGYKDSPQLLPQPTASNAVAAHHESTGGVIVVLDSRGQITAGPDQNPWFTDADGAR